MILLAKVGIPTSFNRPPLPVDPSSLMNRRRDANQRLADPVVK
jgi:hypothetical protein